MARERRGEAGTPMAAIAVEPQEKGKSAGREIQEVELGLGLGFTPKAYFLRFASKTRTRCQVIDKWHGGSVDRDPTLPYC